MLGTILIIILILLLIGALPTWPYSSGWGYYPGGGLVVGGERRLHMRSITFMGTAAAVLTASTLLTAPASADRVCHKVCNEGFCKTTCVQRNDRLYMHDRD